MKNSMIRKQIISIMLALVVVFSVTGCQKTWMSGTLDKTEASEEEILLEKSKETLQIPATEETMETADGTEGSTEILPVPSRETKETEITVEKEKIEIVYELDSEQEFYYIQMPLNCDIEKEGDHYVITGEKHYAGEVVITWQQKELLDTGAAVLKIMYQGKAVDQISMIRISWEPHSPGEDYTYYSQYGGYSSLGRFRLAKSPEADQRVKEKAGIDFSQEPYYGAGYLLDYIEDIPRAYYTIVLEKEYRLEIPADTIIEPYHFLAYTYSYRDQEAYEELVKQTWTVDRYYAEAIVPDNQRGHWLHIYEENGEVVKIVEPFTV